MRSIHQPAALATAAAGFVGSVVEAGRAPDVVQLADLGPLAPWAALALVGSRAFDRLRARAVASPGRPATDAPKPRGRRRAGVPINA